MSIRVAEVVLGCLLPPKLIELSILFDLRYSNNYLVAFTVLLVN